MSSHNAEFALILNHVVKITRRGAFSETEMGQRRTTTQTTIASAASVFFYMNSGSLRMNPSGNFQPGDYTMMALPTLDIQTGDLIQAVAGVDGLTLGEVLNVMAYRDFDGLTHHVDAQIKKLG